MSEGILIAGGAHAAFRPADWYAERGVELMLGVELILEAARLCPAVAIVVAKGDAQVFP